MNKKGASWSDIPFSQLSDRLQVSLMEMLRQFYIAKEEYLNLLDAINRNSAWQAFMALSAIQHAAVQGMTIAWPGKRGDKLRGRWIRVLLYLKEDDWAAKSEGRNEARDSWGNTVYSPHLRHAMAHMDERLDDFLVSRSLSLLQKEEEICDGEKRIYATLPKYNKEDHGRSIGTYISVIPDPEKEYRVIVNLCGEKHDISDLDNQIDGLIDKIENCLDSYSYLDVVTETRGKILLAEELKK